MKMLAIAAYSFKPQQYLYVLQNNADLKLNGVWFNVESMASRLVSSIPLSFNISDDTFIYDRQDHSLILFIFKFQYGQAHKY